jgi:hypothetical protein
VYATPSIGLSIRVTERVGGTVVVGESGEWYRSSSTLLTDTESALLAITAWRKASAPAWLRSRISSRSLGRGKAGAFEEGALLDASDSAIESF